MFQLFEELNDALHFRDTIALRVTSASWKKQGVTTFNQNHSAFQV